MSKYMITGGTGFIGSNLIKNLIVDDTVETVYCIIRYTSHKPFNSKKIKYIYSEDDDNLVKAIKDTDYLVHLATYYTMNDSNDDILELMKTNIWFPTKLLSLINKTNKNIVITCASTFSELDGCGNYFPNSFYDSTKKAFEDTAQYFRDLSIHFLSFPDVYGKDDTRNKIYKLLKQNKEWPFVFKSPAHQSINMMDVRDVVEYLKVSLKDSTKGIHFHDIFVNAKKMNLLELSKIITDKECIFPDTNNIKEVSKIARDFSEDLNYYPIYTHTEFEEMMNCQ